MTKKFAVLAVMAAMFVACGGNSQAEMEAKMKHTADSLAAAMKADSVRMAEEAARAMATADSLAAAMKADSLAKAAEAAAAPAKKGH